MKGYKVFNPDWTCRDFKYEVGQSYELNKMPVVCKRGFHFCERLSDCFDFYEFNPDNKVAEIEAYGDVFTDSDNKKYVTNKIKIIRELSWYDVLCLCNTGVGNAGNRNTGDGNTGNNNTGNRNTGYNNGGNNNTGNYNIGNRNNGFYNIGDFNTGDGNTGNLNTGFGNTGARNTGDWNTGSRNTGDWNKANRSTGVFNTINEPMYMFNKRSNMYYSDWFNSRARKILDTMPTTTINWISSKYMIDKEKEANPSYKTIGGYLKVYDKTDTRQEWWNELSDADKQEVMNLPNFNADIFKEITGIEVR